MSVPLALATPLIKKIAGSALDRIIDAGGRKPAENDVIKALMRLVNNKLLPLSKDGDVTDDVIALVKNGIGNFQRRNSLPITDSFSSKTLKAILAKGCNGQLQDVDDFDKTPASTPDGVHVKVVRYWYDKSNLPKVKDGDPVELIRESWVEWAQHVLIDILEVENKEEANVVIFQVKIDGAGGALADAHKGPPKTRQNELRFDSGERWTAKKFRYAAVHEMGHILGLSHISEPGHIMSEYKQEGISSPTSRDIEELLKVRSGYWMQRPPSPTLPPELEALKQSGSNIVKNMQ